MSSRATSDAAAEGATSARRSGPVPDDVDRRRREEYGGLSWASACGYVAGRMARFNGPQQGVATWLIGLIVTGVLAVAGVLVGALLAAVAGGKAGTHCHRKVDPVGH